LSMNNYRTTGIGVLGILDIVYNGSHSVYLPCSLAALGFFAN
jgi:hypothetical protein